MAAPESSVVAQEIYVQKYLYPDATLSEVIARLPYTTLSNILGLSYGNSSGMFASDQKLNTIELSDSYQVSPDQVNPQLNELISQMEELAVQYALKDEHVSVGQFCFWAQIEMTTFDVIREYCKLFHSDRVTTYKLVNPFSTSKNDLQRQVEFIATPDTVDQQWGKKQFAKPAEKKKGKK